MEGAATMVVDGMVVGQDYLEGLNVFDIDQVDLIKGVAASIFGMRGDGGAIVIFTKDGKTGYRDCLPYNPPPYAKSIMPLGIQSPIEFYVPQYKTPQPDVNPKPDLRTTIHRQPVLQTDANGKASFEFYTADADSSYTILIEGITPDGKIIHRKKKIERR
ncbi:MAG: Plug domain-containing protein [Tannerellaceae bacterium]|jgi:hypothetical protein|nr:Plug domain-containing protein [Tannerellaceae bacterium]